MRYTYDVAGRRTGMTVSGQAPVSYTYDANARLRTITQAPLNPVAIDYDAANRRTLLTLPNGVSTEYQYAPASRLTALLYRNTLAPLGDLTYQYGDYNGGTQASCATYNGGTQASCATDEPCEPTSQQRANLTAITSPRENLTPEGSRLQTAFTYNPFGQPLTVTDPLGHTTAFEYDTVGNLTATIDPLGHRTERTYDTVSRLVASTDAKGAVTQFAYDPLDRLVTTTDPLGGVTRFTYDPTGNLLTVTDAKTQTTTHTYDPMNRLATRTDPLNRVERFTYDGNGNLATVTDRKNQTTTHSYDATNRRVRTEYADGSSVSFSYDAAGNLLTATDSLTGPLTYAYDAVNRRTAEQSNQGTVLYTYDAASRRAAMQASGLQPVTYAHDANSRLTGIAQATQGATLAYDPASRRTALVLPNGITVTYSYDEASRLIGQTYTGPGGVLGDLTYQYDVTGNRVGTGGSFARTIVPSTVPTADYDPSNAQLAFGPVTQTFDPNGNLLTQTDASGTTTYMWDARNRLASISGPAISASFAYDSLGRRISKTVNGQTTTFLYDGLDIIREGGGGGEASYLRTLSIDEALSRSDAVDTFHYLPDALGSTVALTTAAGTAATTYAYEPFGRTEVTGTSSANVFQFTGRENDGTGLYYYRARYYDPTRSRFVSEDPIGLEGGINSYRYAQNNPLTFTDPDGHLAIVAVLPVLIPAAEAALGATIGLLSGAMIASAISSPGGDDDCSKCERAKADAQRIYDNLTKKRIPQYVSGGTRGSDPNHYRSIIARQRALQDALRRVRLYCRPVPPEYPEWERVATQDIPILF